MKKWTVEVKRTTTQWTTVYVEAEDWEAAEALGLHEGAKVFQEGGGDVEVDDTAEVEEDE